MITRRQMLRGGILAGFALILPAAARAGTPVKVLKSASCGCCAEWGNHMRDAGYDITEHDLPLADLSAAKIKAGLKQGQTSCHTGFVDGYVVEGHVPAREVTRLLNERPDAIGLTVPDMPYGSPGMGDVNDAEPYEVLLVKRDGSTEVFASYR